ncbi:MAG TPA: hypothetical protein VGM33_26555 [Baekduia sp.]
MTGLPPVINTAAAADPRSRSHVAQFGEHVCAPVGTSLSILI